MAELNLEEELDTLYALPLGEFIGARNELAKRLKAGGDGEAAATVKALAKPSVTAWAANALYHQERQLFDDLLDAASSVRAALSGKGDRRQAEAAKRQALKALLSRAAKILAAAGHAATPANRQRISHTLETLAARDPAVEGPRPGRLAADLEPQGFDILAGLAASLAPATAPAGKAGQDPIGKTAKKTAKKAAATAVAVRDEKLEAARRKLAEEEAELGRLERQAEESEVEAAAATERHQRLAEEAAEATRRAAAARKAAAAAKDDLATAKAAAAKASAARRRGRSRVATARRKVERQER